MIDFKRNPYGDRCNNTDCKSEKDVFDIRVNTQVVTLCTACCFELLTCMEREIIGILAEHNNCTSDEYKENVLKEMRENEIKK